MEDWLTSHWRGQHNMLTQNSEHTLELKFSQNPPPVLSCNKVNNLMDFDAWSTINWLAPLQSVSPIWPMRHLGYQGRPRYFVNKAKTPK